MEVLPWAQIIGSLVGAVLIAGLAHTVKVFRDQATQDKSLEYLSKLTVEHERKIDAVEERVRGLEQNAPKTLQQDIHAVLEMLKDLRRK